MKFLNPFKEFTKTEWIIWLCSVFVIIATSFIGGTDGILGVITSLLGVTAVMFVSKGDVTGQMLSVVFSLLYAFISYQTRYYGEMITYLFMTAPVSLISVITWLKNPYSREKNEVKIHKIRKNEVIAIFLIAAVVTFVFYFILKFLNTANLVISTISITTSFVAASFAAKRSPYYAFFYMFNDIVLIVMWIMVTVSDISYVGVIICFVMFLVNDIYGFYNWKRIEKRQNGC